MSAWKSETASEGPPRGRRQNAVVAGIRQQRMRIRTASHSIEKSRPLTPAVHKEGYGQLVSSMMKSNNGGQQIVAQPVTGKEGDLKQLSHPSIRQ